MGSKKKSLRKYSLGMMAGGGGFWAYGDSGPHRSISGVGPWESAGLSIKFLGSLTDLGKVNLVALASRNQTEFHIIAQVG